MAGGFVPAAMTEAGVEVDARGLMPLAQAREIIAATPSLARGDGRRVGATWVWDHDRVWAALLSLADADEAAAALARVDLAEGPRGAATNVALTERYGDGALRLIAARRRPDGVVAAAPVLRATAMAVGSAAGFGLVWDVAGWDEVGGTGSPDEQASALFAAWVTAHPAVGFVELGRLAVGGDAAARSFLHAWATPQARKVFGWLRAALGDEVARELYRTIGLGWELAPAHVLAALDYAAVQATDGWPRFRVEAGPSREYHALRLIGARVVDGDDWIVVIERFEGYGRNLRVQRYVYSDDLPSGKRDESREVAAPHDGEPAAAQCALIEAPDYWTRIDAAPTQVGRARALLASTPTAVWDEPAAVVAAVGRAAEVLVVSTAFAHTQGPPAGEPLPSAQPMWQSLAAALVARDGAQFAAGESNLDVARYVAVAEAPEESEDEDSEDEE